MNIKRFGTLILVVTILAMTGGCERHGQDVPAEQGEKAELPDQEMWDSRVFLTNAGKKNAILTAKHIAKFEKKKEINVDGVQVDFFDQDGEHSSVLTAKRGRVDEATNNLEAIDDVVVVSDDGIRLETAVLLWDSKLEKIKSDAFVKITTSVDTITGKGFESDPDLEHWEIKSNIRGSFKRDVTLE